MFTTAKLLSKLIGRRCDQGGTQALVTKGNSHIKINPATLI